MFTGDGPLARVLRMPDVGADSDEAVLAAWLVEESARFDAAQTIAYVETHDELFSVEAGRPGVLLKALAEPGTPVESGTPIGVLGEVWERVHDLDALLVDLGLEQRPLAVVPSLQPLVPAATTTPPPGTQPTAQPTAQPSAQPTAQPPADPLAPAAVTEDVLGVRDPFRAEPAAVVTEPAESQHHYLRATVRVDRLVALTFERHGRPGTPVIDLVSRAVVAAHRQVPQIGVARLEIDRAASPGIPVTHPGRFGVEEAAAVVPQGEAAVLAVGSVRDAPVVDGASVVAGKAMTLTLSIKAGGVDDASASRWLAVLTALLERPEWMAE
jgi:pyruvate/2-oxoglutarate dehydrogenase complex dihydrolipoamide acyltransferase (E2) component